MKTSAEDLFIEKLRQQIDSNLTNTQFGVEELAKNIGLSRSQLHRKLNATTGQSVSQFIREYRLQLAMSLLKKGELTATEVANQTGFGSATYFNKCFNEYYGFPPGEVKNRIAQNLTVPDAMPVDHAPGGIPRKNSLWKVIAGSIGLLIIAILIFVYTKKPDDVKTSPDFRDKSLAILPFKNLSEDQHNEYFSEGVIEAIRTNLAQVGALRVISRTSVEQYKESAKSAREIADELGVTALLEGSVQRNDNKVRIDVHLVDGVTEEQLWAKSYDRELEDVFAIQTEIAQQVADELNAKLSFEEKTKLSRSDTKNPKAYDLYLKGVYEYRTYTNQGVHNGIELLTQAIALDPNYAKANAYLANCYIGLCTIFGAELSAIEGLGKGKPYIDKALQLDSDLDIARMLKGFYLLYHDWNFDAAESEYKRAIVNDDPDALALYTDYLNFVRRHDEAMKMAERLNEVDPYYPNSRMTYSYVYTNQPDKALPFSEARIKLFNNYLTFDSHGFLMMNMGKYKEAIKYFNKAIDLEGIRYPRMLGWMGAAYAKDGDKENALKIIDELKTRLANNDKASISFFVAVIYSALEDKKSALQWLEKSYATHDMEIPWLLTEPQFYSLHDEPEFKILAIKIGFREEVLNRK